MKNLKRCLDLYLPIGQSSFLWGARKTGKSTYLKQTYPNSLYFDVLLSEVYYQFLETPQFLRQELMLLPESQRMSPVIIDEIQKVPLLLDEIHWMIENLKPLSFILCGSSSRRLRKEGVNLLGGRAWRHTFMPLIFPELPFFDLIHIFKTGLLPAHFLSPTTAINSIKSYVQGYLIQEIQFEGSVRNLKAFIRFLELMASTHGELINYANIARDCGVDAKTIKGYFEILEEMFLGTFVDVFSDKPGRHLMTAHPRFYFFDVGIANFLCGRSINNLRGSDAGRAFEHYLFYELNAYRYRKEKEYDLQTWRTKSGLEVDFILDRGRVAIESKMTTAVQKKDLIGLLEFHKLGFKTDLYIVCLEPRPRLITIDNVPIRVYPIKHFLEKLWMNEIL
ncbi:MAG: ATP-binding protein [Proteobacteria bacterium]|nr:ATP-binding protein [Pseudomonadota bacterium]